MAEAVTVAVRVRPLNSKEKKNKCTEIQKISGKSITVTNPSDKKAKKFTFDYVYGTNTTQEAVYKDLGTKYIENIWAGYNCTLFAYGQTGSGKSYSMTGDKDPETSRGIIPRGCEEIFNRISQNKESNVSYEVRVSFLELYNEKLQDLLDPKTSKTIKIRESKEKGVYVENALEEPVQSYKEIEQLLDEGNKARTVAATAMNATSSRSHSVLTIYFTKKETVKDATTQRNSRLNLVDLAGSERQSKTEATGQRLSEACAINKSLSALGNVITALANQAKGQKNVFVPYRDSILTRMLQDSLGGNSKTIMIAAMSPASSNYDESVSTLEYADRAKSIKNTPEVNESATDKLINDLRSQIEALKAQLGDSAVQAGEGNNDDAVAAQQQAIEDEIAAERDKLNAEIEETEAMQAELNAQLAQLKKEQEEVAKKSKEQNVSEEDLRAELQKRSDELHEQQKKMEQREKEQQAAAEALAAKEEESASLAKANAEALDNLKVAQKQLEDYTLTVQDRMKQTEEARNKRKEFLADAGLDLDEMMTIAGVEKGGPQLKNVSISSDMCGTLVYFLREGTTTLGSNKEKATIIVGGMGIEEQHANFIYDKEKQSVICDPLDTARVYRNGELITEDYVEISPGDHLLFGRYFVLRFDHPNNHMYADPILKKTIRKYSDSEAEIEELQAELALAHGNVSSIEEYKRKANAMGWLMHADDLIDEANAIAKKLKRKVSYSMDIDQDNKTVTVVVNSFEVGAMQKYDISILESSHLPGMRSMLKDFVENGKITEQPAVDPFFDPPTDVKVGEGKLKFAKLMTRGVAGCRVNLINKELDAELDKDVDTLQKNVNAADSSSSSSGVDTSGEGKEDLGYEGGYVSFGGVSVSLRLRMRYTSDEYPKERNNEKNIVPEKVADTEEERANQREKMKEQITKIVEAATARAKENDGKKRKKQSVPAADVEVMVQPLYGERKEKKEKEKKEKEKEEKKEESSSSSEEGATSSEEPQKKGLLPDDYEIDTEELIGNTGILYIDIKGASLSSFVQETCGLFVHFTFTPQNSEEVTPEVDMVSEEEISEYLAKKQAVNKNADANAEGAKNEEKLKRKIFRFKPNDAHYVYEFPNMTQEDIDALKNLVIKLDVYAHKKDYGGPTTEEEHAVRALEQDLQRSKQNEKTKTEMAKNTEAEIEKAKAQLAQLQKKLEEEESSSCSIL